MDRIDMHGPNGILRSLRAKGTAPVSHAEHARPAGTEADRAAGVALNGVGLAGTEAPVDRERVTELRQAIEQGRYRLDPRKTADAMIAAGFMPRNER